MAGLLQTQEKERQQNLFSPPSQNAIQFAVTLTLNQICRLTLERMKTCQHRGCSQMSDFPEMQREGRKFAAEVPCRCLAAGQCLPVPASPRWKGSPSPRSEAARPGTAGHSPATAEQHQLSLKNGLVCARRAGEQHSFRGSSCCGSDRIADTAFAV